MASSQTKEIENLLGQLCEIIDQLERRLRVYDSAVRHFKASNERFVSLLDDSLILAETQPIMQNGVSDEPGALRQDALALVSRVLLVIRNLHIVSE